jgi:uncharacterized RDD family membrane protein YckC
MDAPPATEHGTIAGFWIRVAADFLDALILYVIGFLLSLPLRQLFLRLGERGVLIGLAVSLAYGGLLQSHVGGGQTLAKRLLRLRVVRPDGALISLDRSLVRYALVSFIVYQSAVTTAVVTLFPFIRMEWAQAVRGALALVLFAGCVLVVPFHPLRRGLHDLLAGTIVVRGGPPDPARVAALTDARRDRRIVIGAVALLVVGIAASLTSSRRSVSAPSMPTVAHVIPRLPLLDAGVTDTAMFGLGRTRRVLVSGFLPRAADGGEPDAVAAEGELLSALRDDTAAADDVDTIGTALRAGFNIGIFRSYETRLTVEDRRTGAVVTTSTTHSWCAAPGRRARQAFSSAVRPSSNW